MRYYLDTNILVFITSHDKEALDVEVEDVISDCSNIIYASSVAINELIQLYKSGKINPFRCKHVQDMLDKIERIGVETVYYNSRHLQAYIKLQIAEGHTDMNDHAIIAQAVSDKIPLISSDRAFKSYVSQGLDLIFNRR